MRLQTTSLVACLCATAFLHGHAQTTRASLARDEFAVFAGIAQGEQLNATASPLRFRGHGYSAGAVYRRSLRASRFTFVASLDGRARSVVAIDGAAAPTERLLDGTVTAVLLREFTRSANRPTMAAGLAVAGDLSITTHRYTDPARRLADFLAGFLTLGPAVAWHQPIAGGTALLQIAMPVIGLADHPYSDTRSTYSPTTIRVIGPGSLRGLNGVITYAPAERRHIGIVYAYRFALLTYADVQPLRTASQSLSVGIVTRFGGRAQ